MKINYQRLKQYLEATGSGGDKSLIKSWFSSVQGEKELQENSFKYWGEIQADMVPEHYDESQVLGGIYRKIKLREGKIRSVPSVFMVKAKQTAKPESGNIVGSILSCAPPGFTAFTATILSRPCSAWQESRIW